MERQVDISFAHNGGSAVSLSSNAFGRLGRLAASNANDDGYKMANAYKLNTLWSANFAHHGIAMARLIYQSISSDTASLQKIAKKELLIALGVGGTANKPDVFYNIPSRMFNTTMMCRKTVLNPAYANQMQMHIKNLLVTISKHVFSRTKKSNNTEIE